MDGNDIVRCTYPACPEGSCCANPVRSTLADSEAIVKRAREIEEELRKALPLNTDFADGWQQRYLDRQNERYEKALEMARAEAMQELPRGELTEDEWRDAAAENKDVLSSPSADPVAPSDAGAAMGGDADQTKEQERG